MPGRDSEAELIRLEMRNSANECPPESHPIKDIIGCGDSGLAFRCRLVKLVDMTSRNEIDMREIQASEAKTHLPRLLDEVERGETIIITRHGRAIARIVPEVSRRRAEIGRAVTDLRALRASIAERGVSLSWDELKRFRDKGRR
jgi:prevent-host-death family protein